MMCLPLVPDRLAGAVRLAPAGALGGLLLKPLLEVRGRHIDELIEFPR